MSSAVSEIFDKAFSVIPLDLSKMRQKKRFKVHSNEYYSLSASKILLQQ